MPDIVHICYPGIGGQAAVATGLAVEGMRAGVSQGVIFYGVEPTATQYIELCNELGIDHLTIVKKPGIGLSARRKLASSVRKMEPRVVISHHHDTAISVAASGVLNFGDPSPARVFVEHHSNALKSSKDWMLSTLAHRFSDHTVYLTETYRSEVSAKIGKWFANKKASVIANGLDLSLYQPAAPSLSVTVIGMQGRMDTGKDFESLIRAFAALDQAHQPISLELVGDGPHRPLLEKLAHELGIAHRVSFTGFLSQKALIARMQEWHIAVLMTMGETLSMAILESWALELPLITTRVPGVESLVNHEVDGLLVAAADVSDLTSSLAQLMAKIERAKDLGKAGRQRIEQEFNREKIGSQYLTLANRLAPKTIHNITSNSPELKPTQSS